ncbi:type II toxin-antitoxin system VapC family toxin [Altericista sp. CCNU0014]|uniref:type II toxin-antitoxin system VapC family toxin n=1 Tax=Altericista sp. CCNU0014 TaxID=3082949 RepID=UPI00384B1C6A
MSLWIFDTDHISLVMRGYPQVVSRLGQVSAQTSTTIITVQEIFNGWVGELNQASATPKTMLDQYRRLYLAIELLKRLPILEFNVSAFNLYEDLLKQNPNLRKKRLQKDMRIASIALSLDATVVTRNRRDFEQVPGLKIEDWTV